MEALGYWRYHSHRKIPKRATGVKRSRSKPKTEAVYATDGKAREVGLFKSFREWLMDYLINLNAGYRTVKVWFSLM